MRFGTEKTRQRFRVGRSIEIEAPVERVFAHWSRYEELPRLMPSVRRTKCIDERHVLWDVDIAGRQVVWEARVSELVPGKQIRWESAWGACHSGEVRFEALADGRTRLGVEIEYQPQGLLEQLGARLGLVDHEVERDLASFRRFVEGLPAGAATPDARTEARWRSSTSFSSS